MFITNGAPVIVTLLAFTLYPYLQHEPLSAAKAFSSLALFDILSLPLHLFPLIVNVIINGKVRFKVIYINWIQICKVVRNKLRRECLTKAIWKSPINMNSCWMGRGKGLIREVGNQNVIIKLAANFFEKILLLLTLLSFPPTSGQHGSSPPILPSPGGQRLLASFRYAGRHDTVTP